MRAKLRAEQAAKAKAREAEDAAALRALEDQLAKEAAAARLREHEEAMALVRAEKRKATMVDDGVEVVEVRLLYFSLAIRANKFIRSCSIRRVIGVRERRNRCPVSGGRTGRVAFGARIQNWGAATRRRR
jgi:hypothetical protein